MTTPTRDEAVRQQFEAWLVDRRMSVERDERHGYYLDDATQDAWLGYQAALRSPAVAGLVEALKLAREEMDGLPRSLGYDFTHIPKIDATLAKGEGKI